MVRELSQGWHGNLLTVHFRELSDCPPESTASSVNNWEFLEEVGYLSCGAKIPVISAEDSVSVRKAGVFLLSHCRSYCSKERTRLHMTSIYPSRSDPDVTYDAIKGFYHVRNIDLRTHRSWSDQEGKANNGTQWSDE